MIIALSGYGLSGKDTFADMLVEDHGFVKYAWADTLRLAASALNPIVAVVDGKTIRYNDAVEEVGYNQAKVDYPEVRRVLQYLGTDVGRNLIDDNVWVDATLSRIGREQPAGSNVVIADTRFPNEAEAIKSLEEGGERNYTVRITRPGIGPAGDHQSETALDDFPFDFVFSNSGTLDDLRFQVYSMCKTIGIVD